mgnify:CR=1 FL=1
MRASVRLRGKPCVDEVEVDTTNFQFVLHGKRYQTDRLMLESPVSGTVYGTLLNYKGALAALGDAVHAEPYRFPPVAPVLYIKPVNTIIGHGMPIPLPNGIAELEVGASLGVVISRTATRVTEQRALEYVAGYTVVNDVCIPHSSYYRPAVKQRARDGFCPIGPWVIERDAVPHPDCLRLRVYINDELRQENSTANWVRSVSRLIADVTEFMTLNAGDVLLTGVPEGAPRTKAGDRIRIEIEQVGKLENTVVPEDEWIPGGTL